MRVVELYKILDNNIYIRIIDENGSTIMWGLSFDIPVGVLDCRVKSIRKPKSEISIADIEIVIEG